MRRPCVLRACVSPPVSGGTNNHGLYTPFAQCLRFLKLNSQLLTLVLNTCHTDCILYIFSSKFPPGQNAVPGCTNLCGYRNSGAVLIYVHEAQGRLGVFQAGNLVIWKLVIRQRSNKRLLRCHVCFHFSIILFYVGEISSFPYMKTDQTAVEDPPKERVNNACNQ